MRLFRVFLVIFLVATILKADWEHKYALTYSSCFNSSGNTIYIGRMNGLTFYNMQDKSYQQYTPINSDLPGYVINSIVKMKDGSYLVSTNGGLAAIENGQITADKAICKDYPDKDARDLYIQSNGDIWTFSGHKVHKYSNNKWKSYNLEDSVNYMFDISRLFINDNMAIALFNDNTKTETKYYFSTVIDEYLKLAVITDTGIVRTFQTKNEFPYRQGYVYLAMINNGLILSNYDGSYIYYDKTFKDNLWDRTNAFSPSGDTRPARDFLDDGKGNLWFTARTLTGYRHFPVSYNIATDKVTEYMRDDEDSIKYYMTILDDGTVVTTSRNYYYFKRDTGWERKSLEEMGLTPTEYTSLPFQINGKLYVTINHITSGGSNKKLGTIYCLDDKTSIEPVNSEFPYTSLTQACINKWGKGMYKGRYLDEYYRHEADSGFVNTAKLMVSNESKTLPAADGNVYFSSLRYDNSIKTPYLATWEGNEIKKISMGNIDKEDCQIVDFDTDGDDLVSVGQYLAVSDTVKNIDSLDSYLSVYNTTTKQLSIYDKTNSLCPDFYDEIWYDIMHIRYDTIPGAVTIDRNKNIWLLTSESLIDITGSKVYSLPLPYVSSSLYSDATTNELICMYHKKFYMFDKTSHNWDSLDITEGGFKGQFTIYKKLLDGNVWAGDDQGYLYKYSGKGKFTQFDLKINGRPNLRVPINDMSIDANSYLHLATDVGLLTNKTILTGIEESHDQAISVVVSPNPASDYVTIRNIEAGTGLEVCNSLGVTVQTMPSGSNQTNEIRIDVSGFEPGVYFLKTGGRAYKFVKI